MGVLPRIKQAIWTALVAAVLCQPVSALGQTESASELDIWLEEGRLTMNVRDASLSRVLRAVAAEGGFALDMVGQLDSTVSQSFENIPIERAVRRIVGRWSYIIELAQSTGTDAPRRIGRLYVFARGAAERVKSSGRPATKPTKRRKSDATKRRTSSATKSKRRKSSATNTKR